jgi:hypothetical protein
MLVIARRRHCDGGRGQLTGGSALLAAAVVEDCSGNGSQADGPVLDTVKGIGLLVRPELVSIH